ncbi:MerR family transcriptional regulator [Nocardia seriolae]|uniref:Multidrug-efflux transporter 1 regulator n=1 Tax=Nocardia seriolae TaxID=37332 RepID=A0A0B8NT17_9NOCA|nr:MerR family transcriptional regulator [Nocardia seriolae]APA95005.1 Multidrug-efflux transporter 1 regulator [Nocardia seriolae]MTJ60287.1 MerR family transcriptional regulator [Nocardia seriolae]MTJ76534.1 MerR family transcriptional regulator [Nocardia seriolae]MTJ85278.1 MerR family transcriptional regulator [Nocardia seriolae]MTK29274.1 MerR family transcriptional regulator [Nocardia seriolae]
MTATVPIGEFSRLTYLTIKTLRYYHEIELLEPVAIDPDSGYRFYSTAQVDQAHLIKRLRELNMPLPEIKAVMAAPDQAARDAGIRAHLERMEAELVRTRDVVASLEALLLPATGISVEYRSIASLPVLAMTTTAAREDCGPWCEYSFGTLYGSLAAAELAPAGPGGATYAPEFFEYDRGEVVTYVPIEAGHRDRFDTALVTELPARRFAVTVHAGAFDDFDRTYGALGSHVAEHDSALPEPVREIYLVGPGDAEPADYRTEVCWPIGRI